MSSFEMTPEEERVWLDEATEIGKNHWYKFFTNTNGERVGIFHIHRGMNGFLCIGSIRWDAPGESDLDKARWELKSLSPLHVEPSLACGACGDHGFIRNGKWVPA